MIDGDRDLGVTPDTLAGVDARVTLVDAARSGSLVAPLGGFDKVSQNLAPVDLNALSTEYVEDRAAMAKKKGLNLRLELIPDQPVVNADRNLLGQSVSILLTNALNYTPKGGEVVVSTQMRSSDGKKWAGMCVSDTGPGIPKEYHEKVFQLFQTLQSRDKVEGSGMGLSLVNKLVVRYGGRVEIESEEGSGSTFIIIWPIEAHKKFLSREAE